MATRWTSRAIWVVLFGLLALGTTWFAWPRPIAVDIAVATKGPMQVTIDEEAKTRVRHIYTVSAPTAGKVLRISHPLGQEGTASVHVGDEVKAAESVVAVMQPTVPSFLDARSREELQAMLSAADAAIALAEAEVKRIEAALEFARSELRRAEALAKTSVIAERTLEKARLDVQMNEAALASAKAQLDVRRSERATVAARLSDPSSTVPDVRAGCCIQLRAPISGVVLKIIQDSETVVAAGTPLIEIGDPRDLEVIADLLSTDAVRVKSGAPVQIVGWGGEPIQGRVVRVDPAGFLKVSALGIEEQRVRTTIDFLDPPAAWARLGHDYRAIVQITIWRGEQVLTIPVGALFRKGDEWAVFTVRDGRVQTTSVKIGQRNSRAAEILSGLAEGDRVVVHPSDRLREGTAVSQRQTQ